MGMPLSVDRFLITVTKSGNPTSSGRDSISKTTPDIVVTQVSINRAGDSQEQPGKDRRGRGEHRSETKNVTNEEKGSEDRNHTSKFVDMSVERERKEKGREGEGDRERGRGREGVTARGLQLS